MPIFLRGNPFNLYLSSVFSLPSLPPMGLILIFLSFSFVPFNTLTFYILFSEFSPPSLPTAIILFFCLLPFLSFCIFLSLPSLSCSLYLLPSPSIALSPFALSQYFPPSLPLLSGKGFSSPPLSLHFLFFQNPSLSQPFYMEVYLLILNPLKIRTHSIIANYAVRSNYVP